MAAHEGGIKEEFARFGLPYNQAPVEVSNCGYGIAGQKKPIDGVLYLSSDYACFGGAAIVDVDLLIFPLSEVASIETVKAKAFTKVLQIEYKGEKHWFHNVDRKEEFGAVLQNFWEAANDTTLRAKFETESRLYDMKKRELLEVERQMGLMGDDGGGVLMDINTGLDSTTAAQTEDETNPEDDSISGPSTKASGKALPNVDSDATKRSLMLARQAQAAGSSTLVALDEQNDRLQEIQMSLQRTNAELAASERHLRGIRSLGGASANGLSSSAAASLRSQKSLRELVRFMDLNVPIVRINDRGKYQPRVLRLSKTEMQRVMINEGGGEKVRDTWSYDDVVRLIFSTTPERMCIKFESGEVFHLVTAFYEILEVELPRRSSRFIDVIKEGSDGGDAGPEVARASSSSSAGGGGGGGTGPSTSSDLTGGGLAPSGAASPIGFTSRAERDKQRAAARAELLPTSAQGGSSGRSGGKVAAGGGGDAGDLRGPLENRQQMQEALARDDKNVEELSQVLNELKGIATAMGESLDMQNKQLDAVTANVDSTNARLKKDNKEIIRML